MTILIHGRASPGKTEAAAALLAAGWRRLAGAFHALHKAWEVRQASVALWSMGPEMLRDIGIEPSEIDWVVRHGRTSRRAYRLEIDPFERG